MGIAIALSALGAATSAFGQYQAGQAQKQAADYNAKMQEMEADRAREVGIENASRQRRENQRRLASFRAQYARGGVAPQGSYLDFMAGSASDLELRALDIYNQAETTAVGLTNQALSTRYSGQQAARAGAIQGFSTLLGGAASAGLEYAKLSPLKPPTRAIPVSP